MKKLFLFKAVGSYFGGMAGATAETIEEAFKKIAATDVDYPLLTKKYVVQHTEDGNYDGDWGFVFFEMVYADKNMVFCECHDG